jgi:hypothetical protein
MVQFFAVLDGYDRRGPFNAMEEAIRVIKQTSNARGYTEEEAHEFFLHGSAVEQVETVNGKTERFFLGWLARENSVFTS